MSSLDKLLLEKFSLKEYNTFNILAYARYFSSFESRQQLLELISFSEKTNLPFFVLGGGANVLFTKDYDGLIIHPVSKTISFDGDVVVADAGVVWDQLVEMSIQYGYGGLENLSLIPGTVGASPVQNIGAYGVEVKDSILWVEYMDSFDKQVHRITNAECSFGYRDSIFKHELKNRAIVLRVAFALTRQMSNYNYNIEYGALKSKVLELGEVSLENIRKAVVQIRSSKLPDPKIIGSAGSFFRNPEISISQLNTIKQAHPDVASFILPNGNFKISAGWMIEKVGWKGRSFGNASVHDKQALVLINPGSASGEDVLKLSDKIRHDVYSEFGIDLHPEVVLL